MEDYRITFYEDFLFTVPLLPYFYSGYIDWPIKKCNNDWFTCTIYNEVLPIVIKWPLITGKAYVYKCMCFTIHVNPNFSIRHLTCFRVYDISWYIISNKNIKVFVYHDNDWRLRQCLLLFPLLPMNLINMNWLEHLIIIIFSLDYFWEYIFVLSTLCFQLEYESNK